MRYQDYETVAFVGLALLFAGLERQWPLRPGRLGAEPRVDLLALAVLLASVNLSRIALDAAFRQVDLGWVRAALAWARVLPGPLKVLLGILLVDLCLYWIHRAMHAWAPLWRTHAFHHSAARLTWFSGLRTSMLHALLFAVPQVLVPFFLLDLTALEAGLGFSMGVFTQFWEHSNIDADLGWLGRWVVVSPGYHRVHHSSGPHQRKNLAITFVFLDRLFGTWQDPRELEPGYPLGLRERGALGRMVLGV